MTILHPVDFKPFTNLYLQADEAVALLDDLSDMLKHLSVRKLQAYGYTGLHLMDEGAPDSMEELVQAMRDRPYGDNFPIYASHCEKTILAKNCGHPAYRAWHDIVHIEVNGAFTLPGERVVVDAQLAEMRQYGARELDCLAVWYDIMGGLLHNEKYGAFPEHMREFVLACLTRGLPYALAYKF